MPRFDKSIEVAHFFMNFGVGEKSSRFLEYGCKQMYNFVKLPRQIA